MSSYRILMVVTFLEESLSYILFTLLRQSKHDKINRCVYLSLEKGIAVSHTSIHVQIHEVSS